MHFYIDESGNTGTNLFDPVQPFLYYGVIHSTSDLDKCAKPIVKEMRSLLDVERLHACNLGASELAKVVPLLLQIQDEFGVGVDLYRVDKADHALISFFDQVFDAGINPAVPWTSYWTPLRYILLLKLATLFNEKLLKLAWSARIETDENIATPIFVSVCKTVLGRIEYILDARSREIISDALEWAVQNPDRISYHCCSGEQVLNIAPNMIAFQCVMAGISRRIPNRSGATRISVDRQSQFNEAQRELAAIYAKLPSKNIDLGPGLPGMDGTNMPTTAIQPRSSRKSVGLELADLYVWIFKRVREGEALPPAFNPLITSQIYNGGFDEVSLQGIVTRWAGFFESLPEPTPEGLAAAHKMIAQSELNRRQAMAKVA